MKIDLKPWLQDRYLRRRLRQLSTKELFASLRRRDRAPPRT